jgi:hypothetical protein
LTSCFALGLNVEESWRPIAYQDKDEAQPIDDESNVICPAPICDCDDTIRFSCHQYTVKDCSSLNSHRSELQMRNQVTTQVSRWLVSVPDSSSARFRWPPRMQAAVAHQTSPANVSILVETSKGWMRTMNVAPSIIIDTLVALQNSALRRFTLDASLPAADGTSDDSQQVAQQEKIATPENVTQSSSDCHDDSAC